MEIRPWQPADEAAILDLFKITFGSSMREEFWRWRYLDHPAGGPMIVLAWDGDKLAAHYAACHAPLLVDGQPRPAALSMTTMTHPDYRGQGLFERTASALYDQMAEDGLYAVWGFPNRNSNVPFRRKLNWDAIADVSTMVREIREGENFTQGLLVETDQIDARFDTVLPAQEGLQADHRAELLSWRIDRNPVNRYLVLTLPNSEGLDGYAILKPYGTAEYDLVLMAANNDKAYSDLISGSLAAAHSKGARRVNTWSLLSDPARVFLHRAGFEPAAPITYFGGRVLSKDRAGFDDPRRWRLSMLDTDTF